jgi:hypothetical protein
MTRMYPPEVSEETKSHAEKKVFDLIKLGLNDEWIALHSLGLISHNRKPWAEIDFVLIGPPGVFSLEVKGGRVARKDGMWQFTDGQGHTHIKAQGPFEQVGPANAALRANLVDKLPWLKHTAFGYGVLTPDIRFSVEGPDIEREIVFDERDFTHPFSTYMHRLSSYWHARLEFQRGQPVASLSDKERKVVLDQIRGDFDLRPSLPSRVGLAVDELLRLTEEQYRVLDGLTDNERVIVRGGAGTGKTLLAVEEAHSRATRGERILYCCFNRRLAAYVREALADCDLVDVHHLHGFMASIVAEAGLNSKLPSAQPEDLFAVFYPELSLEALLVLDRLQQYDMLVVDEAQDLLRKSYMDVLDALVKGGLKDGKWRFFLDPFQDIFTGSDPEQISRLQATHPAQFRLSINCRNTAPVATAGGLLSGVLSTDTLVVNGPDVEWYWYRDASHARREVSKCLNRMLGEGIKPADLIVLSMRRLSNGSLREGLLDVPLPLVETDDLGSAPSNKAIRFSTVGSFKGLEADVVLLIDIDHLDDPDTLLSIYVGASRARAVLALFINETQREAYEARAYEYGQKLAVASGLVTERASSSYTSYVRAPKS